MALLVKGKEKKKKNKAEEHRATSGYRIFEDRASSCMLVKCVGSPKAA